MSRPRKIEMSRREFARRAAIASAATFVTPSHLSGGDGANSLRQSPDSTSLSPESQSEAETRYQTILKLYGSRLSGTQKTDVQRLCVSGQQALDRLRAYPLENSDNPALYLKPLVEREKKLTVANTSALSSAVPKKP
jgi:hypothetical protein